MDGTTTKFGLHDSIGHQIMRTARLFERRVEDDLRPFGLTRIGWCILLTVHEERKRNPSDIASFVGIDRTATSRALRSLEEMGLIARHMGREDRRTTEVVITELGQSQILAALPRCLETNAHFASKLSDDELDSLKQLLGKLADVDPSA